MKLSNKQQQIHDEIMHFFTDGDPEKQLYIFSGCAGSGKSTIINEINDLLVNQYNLRTANLALTGKAAKVMRTKGIYGAQTIHSFLYKPVVDPTTQELIGFIKKDSSELECDCIIIDEGSMVTEEILKDIMDLGKKVLIVGDVNQLPPVQDRKSNFNVMDLYDVRLEEIHRQAADSPIIKLSQYILENDNLPKPDNEFVRHISKYKLREHLAGTVNDYGTILCGTNKQRVELNNAARNILNRKSRLPMEDDKVICLRNNARNGSVAIFNGDIFYVKKVMPHMVSHKGMDLHDYIMLNEEDTGFIRVVVDDDWWHNGWSKHNYIDEPCDDTGDLRRIFLDVFDFAYAITVWKAQGSEYDNVLFVDEDVSYFSDRAKFRYTAVTRSKNLLTIAK
jgi:exodeoxyribonuclease-5